VRNKSGLSTKVSPVTEYATGAASCATYVTPMVLGMISENKSTAMVNVSENAQSVDSPMAFTYIAPQTEAPTVWATVWNETMAAIGMSISRLNSRKISAARDLPSASICACCTLKMTASAIEQKNEIASEPRTVRTRNSIGAARGHSSAGASVAEWLVSRESKPLSAVKPADCE